MIASSISPIAADVLVVGSGAIGASAALAMSRLGRRVALIGPPSAVAQQPEPGRDNRVYALSAPSIAFLRDLGVWQALDPGRTCPIARMRVWPSAGRSDPKLEFDAHDSAVESLAVIVEGAELGRVLGQALQFSAVQRVETEVIGWRGELSGRAQLTLGDGRLAQGRLVVACDGAESAVRALAGIQADFNDYGQLAIVANFETEKPHRDTAYQWFGEHGVLALLPLAPPAAQAGVDAAGRVSIVWSAPLALAKELSALDPQMLAARVAEASGMALGELKPLSPIAVHPLRLGRVATMIGARLALAGDSAHVVHPLAGQGMNLGFGDVAALCAAVRVAADPGSRIVLRRYERSRAEPVLAMRLVTDGLQRLFDPAQITSLGALGAPLVAIRDLGWRAVASSSWLRRQLVAQAGRR